MNIINVLWLIGIGSILGIVIQHFLNRSSVLAERNYNFKKEELLRYRWIAESVIEKLILVDWYRDLFRIYLQLSYDASCQKWSKFIDLNNTLDKSNFDKNTEQIATMLFLYFSELSEEWNDCLESISKIATLINQIELKNQHWLVIDWKSIITEFNTLNQWFWDKPLELSNKIKGFIKTKEEEIMSQKPTFHLF